MEWYIFADECVPNFPFWWSSSRLSVYGWLRLRRFYSAFVRRRAGWLRRVHGRHYSKVFVIISDILEE